MLDVFFDDQRLARWMAQAREFMFMGIAHDPVFLCQIFHLRAFDDKDRCQMIHGSWSGSKRFEKGCRIFEARLQLIAVGEKNVLAMRFQRIKFKGNVIQDLVARSIKLRDIARSAGVGLQDIGGRVVVALG